MNLKKRKTQDGVALEFSKLPSVLQHAKAAGSTNAAWSAPRCPAEREKANSTVLFGCEAVIALARTLLPTKMMFWVGFERSTSGIESICI